VLESVKPDLMKLQESLEQMRLAGADARRWRRSLMEMAKS